VHVLTSREVGSRLQCAGVSCRQSAGPFGQKPREEYERK
jgi:hypothetical protein